MGVCNCSVFVRYFMSILVLQSSWWGRESWLLCLICLPGVSWWLSGSSSRCHWVVCGLWLWHFLIILTIFQVADSAALINEPTPQNSEASLRWILLDLDIKERRDETSDEIKLYWMKTKVKLTKTSRSRPDYVQYWIQFYASMMSWRRDVVTGVGASTIQWAVYKRCFKTLRNIHFLCSWSSGFSV